eukprot:gene8107-8976_t
MLRTMLNVLALVLLSSNAYGVEVCYPPYGCFNNDAPFHRTLVQLPESPAQIGVQFQLYTRAQHANHDVISDTDASSIRTSTFDGTKKTIFIMHGYLESGSIHYMPKMVDTLLKVEDANVVVVHWKNGAKFPYHQASGNVRLVGVQAGHLVELMNRDFGLNFSNVHLIGFSLGAQIAGYAGRYLSGNNHKIARITGLDAAGPYFEYEHTDVRLDPSDAEFVDAIHTDSRSILIKGFGIHEPAGHVDFYPNGGYEQPDCRTLDNGVTQFFTCSHYRAVYYFTESIDPKGCQFLSYPCSSYDNFKKVKCTTCPTNGCPSMGYYASEHRGKVSGKFYLQTKGQQPFCANHYKITLHTATGLFADLSSGPVKMIITGQNHVSEELELPSKTLDAGSVVDFIVTTRYNLGSLERIKVWHEGFMDLWKLNKVVVQQFNTNNG